MTAESFTSSIKPGCSNQPVSGQRFITQGARKPSALGLVSHSRAGWGIQARASSWEFQLCLPPLGLGTWDFWIHLDVRQHKALSSLCSLQHLWEAARLTPCSPNSSWAMTLLDV